MNTFPPFVILSAERTGMHEEVNAWRTASLQHQLTHRDLSPLPVEGVYQGCAERSFLVFLPAVNQDYVLSMLIGLARRWGQESVLYVDSNRESCLLYSDGRPALELGRWQTVDAIDAKVEESYTYSPDQDAYYITRRA
jgi:hypothetical protein